MIPNVLARAKGNQRIRWPCALGLVLVALLGAACRQSPTPAPSPKAETAAPAPQVAAKPELPPAPPAETRPETPGPRGTLKGKTEWPYIEGHTYNLQILLIGEDPSTQGQMIGIRTKLGEPYSAWVPAGGYLLKAQVGPLRMWERRVHVEPDKETVVDLTPADSPMSTNEFPKRD